MTSNPDIRENHHNARIARQETRKTLVRLFPNLTFNYGSYYDSDRYQVNNSWRGGERCCPSTCSTLFLGPTQMKLAEAGVALADQRRVATQMAVLAQLHLARQQYANAMQQFQRADAIWQTDARISAHMKNREQAQAQSKLDRGQPDHLHPQPAAPLPGDVPAVHCRARLQATLGDRTRRSAMSSRSACAT